MRSDKYLWEKIVLPAYKEMYKKATPSIDIMKVLKAEDKNFNYRDYEIDDGLFRKIVDKALKKCNGKREKDKVSFELYLGFAPKSKSPEVIGLSLEDIKNGD